MRDIIKTLDTRISELDDAIEETEDTLGRLIAKREIYVELRSDEAGEDVPTPTVAKKKRGRGRPRGAKNKKKASEPADEVDSKKDALWEQAQNSLPLDKVTSPEEQERAVRRFNPTARPAANYGVKSGTPEQVLGDQGEDRKSNVHITVEDE